MERIIEKPFPTAHFIKSACLGVQVAAWARKAWDNRLDQLVETSLEKKRISDSVADTLIAENEKTECGREGIAGIIWYLLNKNSYPSNEVIKSLVMDTCLHLFALRVADNWVDEGAKEGTLKRLLALKEDTDKKEENPLAQAAVFLLNECKNKFSDKKGYLGVCNRLFNLTAKIEEYRETASIDELEKIDKEVCFMTVLPVAYLTQSLAGKPQRNSVMALKSMLYGARTMDYLADIKKDFKDGSGFNSLISQITRDNPQISYGALRNEIEKMRPELTKKVLREIKAGSLLLDPVAAGMYWFASLLMYSKYLAQYRLLTSPNSSDLPVKIARKVLRSP